MTEQQNSGAAFVMPEDEWLALCQRQCNARRRDKSLWPDGIVDCERDGRCEECIDDAAMRVPKKYRTTIEDARGYEPLPGCERSFDHQRSSEPTP